MLFYAGLTVAGVIAAAVVVWLVRSMSVAGRSAYRTLSPSGQNSRDVKLAHLNSSLSATPAPWGWGNEPSAPVSGQRFDAHRAPQRPASPSKSKDFSQLEAYARSNEKARRNRDAASPMAGSVRNVLTGYDMTRGTQTETADTPDTSCWPYRDNFDAQGSSMPTQTESNSEDEDRPTKPWGW